MKFSESWLREWVNPTLARTQLGEKLTLSGLEVESITPVAEKFNQVVVGQIKSIIPHPNSDRLTVCQVAISATQLYTIVCGARNVRVDLKTALALPTAKLPSGLMIQITKIRGVESQGMLCSAEELGLGKESEGIIEFPSSALLGKDVWKYLRLADYLWDVSITPNRGDCLSILGIATEVNALTQTPLLRKKLLPVLKPTSKMTLPIKLHAKAVCPRYVGCVVENVDMKAPTPIWLWEHLRRAGIRSINAIVDVTNYVMLELGQPMHAFDLNKIVGSIQVRMAHPNEKLILLDTTEVTLDPKILVIADSQKPLAIAGVMGGLDSGISPQTQSIFLESAFFMPAAIIRSGRHYGVNSESAYRFERGVDPLLQQRAMERALQLILEIAGGKPGKILAVQAKQYLPQPAKIILRKDRLTNILGCEIAATAVNTFLKRLGFSVKKIKVGWQVLVPARRSDIALEIDLIEEIARLYGYDKIPCHPAKALLHITASAEAKLPLTLVRQTLRDLGYHEVVTYSFIDKKLQSLFQADQRAIELVNPISADMAVMRANLFSGLLNTLLYNQNRQQTRIRIFETGLRFVFENDGLRQQRVLSGLVQGNLRPEQWGWADQSVDFFDVKGDLQTLFQLTHATGEFIFKPDTQAVFHPVQTAAIYRNDEYLGVIGCLNPEISQKLKIEGNVYLFEINLDMLEKVQQTKFSPVSRFPEIRRDIAILIKESIPAKAIQDTIKESAGELLKSVDIFDVYQGKEIAVGHKSMALAVTLQHPSRTLVDDEVNTLMNKVIQALTIRFNAELRG